MKKTRFVYLDCEFLPADPTTRGLVSIGLTDDQGVDFYAVNGDMDVEALIANQWMLDNVWPSLPTVRDESAIGDGLDLSYRHQDVHFIPAIRAGVAQYFADTDADETRLFAWYGGQDICRLHSLWDNDWSVMPDQIPRWFTELESLREQAGDLPMPEQESGEHHALADARHNRAMHRVLAQEIADTQMMTGFHRRSGDHLVAKRDLAESVLAEWERGAVDARAALGMIRVALAVGDVKTLDELRAGSTA